MKEVDYNSQNVYYNYRSLQPAQRLNAKQVRNQLYKRPTIDR